jgi:hypothetical protein
LYGDFDNDQPAICRAMKKINSSVEEAVAWISVVKTAGCFLGGGALMGLLRGSFATGALAGLILFAVFLAIALTVIATDYAGRTPARSPAAPLKPEREAA